VNRRRTRGGLARTETTGVGQPNCGYWGQASEWQSVVMPQPAARDYQARDLIPNTSLRILYGIVLLI
jgi:hypothetical protein